MSAVVESIAAVGYQKTTSAEIARRAGVTWGAVQHHFGDKDGILIAVLEASFERFAQLLAGRPSDGADLDKRVTLFVDRSWAHFSSPHYRSTLEILLNLPSHLEPTWQAGMLEAWMGIWSRYFPASNPAKRRTIDLMHYAISVLSGLATTQMLAGPGARVRSSELRYLKETLARELSSSL